MSVVVNTLGDYADNIAAMCDAYFAFAPLKEVIIIWKAVNFGLLNTDMTQEAKNEALKILTTNLVGMQTDLNCYPTGLTTAILFTIDGEPIP